ncbi:hypothetical protein F3Y22_tig00113145pilonHSYRG00200 [Hibiscus syriacus]|uniref:Integrase catalytic domain-containing protein n=1 Tax=Hibiscus syriacus TaxID=106335 RepID=A0A6A2WRD0_HIBSY|nr:hypothetical protein F3Y22_tig00113145pilonHSYRG00200 [Hibiscus syriacus]
MATSSSSTSSTKTATPIKKRLSYSLRGDCPDTETKEDKDSQDSTTTIEVKLAFPAFSRCPDTETKEDRDSHQERKRPCLVLHPTRPSLHKTLPPPRTLHPDSITRPRNELSEEKDSPWSERSQPPPAAKQNNEEGKLPCLVTVHGNNEAIATDPVEEELEISINAIIWLIGHHTLRIEGHISGRPLNILIDSGSTHSFITGQWSKEGVELEQTHPLTITVANGEKLYSSAMSKKLKWGMQGSQFEHDFRVLTLEGSDMVLGVDWMKKYSPLLMDFNNMTMSFKKDGEEITLRGKQNSPTVKVISDSKLQKLMGKNNDITGEIFMLSGEVRTNMVPVELQSLLEEYSVVFEEPKGMPPPREHDHSIILKEGTEAVDIRPYRMPYHQKSEVEKQIKEMLSSSIIQTSKSPFASPLEDLLDELTGASYFSKLDLRSGYWQIRITLEDIPKTAFRSNHGHFEFKHAMHLRTVLEVLKQNQLFAKRTKCLFGQQEVEYLGYIISKQGVATDPAKIQAMQQWKLPKTLKSLRGFLGLTGYYRRFIKGYGEIAKPLTTMLKKDQFQWTEESKAAFEFLKGAMCHSPVLALPNFNKSFWLETDASSRGIGAVLSQEGRPVAYLSRALGPRQLDLSIYEKEYLAILMAISKWRHYLEGGPFIIKTDHEALKHLQEQKLTTSIQKKWLTKLLGLDYVIQYRKRRHNLAADALSRKDEEEVELQQMTATVVIPTLVQEVEQSYQGDSLIAEMVTKLAISRQEAADWSYSRSILRYKGKCDIYPRIKDEHVLKPGLLQPLPIPQQAWEFVTMDFIEGLPTSNRYNCILIIIDKFTKYAHFLPLVHPFTAADVAKVYLDQIYKLHGQPKIVLSDRDKIFTSVFWTELMKLLGTTALFTTAYHPKTDGQTERLNQCLEQYLRGMCFMKPTNWSKWLSQAEWWYNTSFHTALGTTPFTALYGYIPPTMTWLTDSKVADVQQLLQERDNMNIVLQDQLDKAQQRMKYYADKKRMLKSQFPDFDPWGQASTAGGAWAEECQWAEGSANLTMHYNGGKIGFATKSKASQHNRLMLKTMQSTTVGAGMIPAGFGSSDSEEIMYMRANNEHIIGISDYESFRLVNPDECSGQELSVFLMRPR